MAREDLDWQRDGQAWPNPQHSRFVQSGGICWHVQTRGHGRPLLILHGTGASTHSCAALADLLARRFRVMTIDLPGHGFTQSAADRDVSLAGFAHLIGGLFETLSVSPKILVGHSAGAAVCLQMALDAKAAPELIVGLNAALFPFGGPASHAFPFIARLLLSNAFMPHVFAWRARNRATVARLLAGTGSDIPDRNVELYARLFRSPAHVAATLKMMANWDLASLQRRLPYLATPILLLVGSRDLTVNPDEAAKAAERIPNARAETVPFAGHLMHEEDPEAIAQLIIAAAETTGLLAAAPQETAAADPDETGN